MERIQEIIRKFHKVMSIQTLLYGSKAWTLTNSTNLIKPGFFITMKQTSRK